MGRGHCVAFSALSLLIFLSCPGQSTAIDLASDTYLRVDPHSYIGARGAEPQTQVVGLWVQRWGTGVYGVPQWGIALHLQSEAVGRRDLSVDLDRFWLRTSLVSSKSGPAFFWGRLHPWDLSENPNGREPWGYLAQGEAQNRGILLGYGFDPEQNAPVPILSGWFGAHYWSDISHREAFQWGASASPLFVPSMGSAVDFSVGGNPNVGRFGRRPPGTLEFEKSSFPIRYEIDRPRILEDVLLKPQLMGQILFRLSEEPWSNRDWATLSRAPAPDPAFEAAGFLRIGQEGVEAVAKVRPLFPQRTRLALTHRTEPPNSPFHSALLISLGVGDDRRWGYEAGVDSDFFSVSLANEQPFAEAKEPFSIDEGKYLQGLVQVDGKLPLKWGTIYFGGKAHWQGQDFWLRGSFRLPVGKKASFDLGADLFNGGAGSYFGEWPSRLDWLQ
jgi:hypothetical protein